MRERIKLSDEKRKDLENELKDINEKIKDYDECGLVEIFTMIRKHELLRLLKSDSEFNY